MRARALRSTPLLVALLFAVACSDDDAPVLDSAGNGDGATQPDSATPDAAPSEGKIGDPCVVDSDCDLDLCLLERGAGVFPGGYCSRSCDAVTDPCPAGAYCVGTEDGDCFKRCSVQSECRSGYRCQEGPGGGAPKICFPE